MTTNRPALLDPPFRIGQRMKVYYLADAWRGGYGTIETLTGDGYADIRSEWNPEIIATHQPVVLFNDASDLQMYPPHKPYVEPQTSAPLNLDPILARLNAFEPIANHDLGVDLWIEGDDAQNLTQWIETSYADMRALIAENMQLRADLSATTERLNQCLSDLILAERSNDG